jgi:hypothetical protein
MAGQRLDLVGVGECRRFVAAGAIRDNHLDIPPPSG